MFGVCIRHNNIGRDKLSLICCIGPIIIPLAADQSPLHKTSHHKVGHCIHVVQCWYRLHFDHHSAHHDKEEMPACCVFGKSYMLLIKAK